eukprot:CAMPEP_0197592682 /NCGR_PEP_ID=MMETSP1326-20131121/15231_1 /TAXON_ID=1155430 /ORGANISM="Genus nov. species nov., Strain RCC2288" /LENGTH=115 /DNA_ID=CAMNT_0043158409 /DNA_START=353 /DNA_END=697 /DNA_ORIENTATION=+
MDEQPNTVDAKVMAIQTILPTLLPAVRCDVTAEREKLEKLSRRISNHFLVIYHSKSPAGLSPSSSSSSSVKSPLSRRYMIAAPRVLSFILRKKKFFAGSSLAVQVAHTSVESSSG